MKKRRDVVQFTHDEMRLAFERWVGEVGCQDQSWSWEQFIKFIGRDATWVDGGDALELPAEHAHKVSLFLSPHWKALYKAHRIVRRRK